jgi:hypothetical protein
MPPPVLVSPFLHLYNVEVNNCLAGLSLLEDQEKRSMMAMISQSYDLNAA